MSYTYGQFRGSVFESLENDQRFEALLDEACNRGIDDQLIDANAWNLRRDTLSIVNKSDYDLPEGTLITNFVTYDGRLLDRMTMREYLTAKTWFNNSSVQGVTGPMNFVEKDNRLLILFPAPGTADKTIEIFVTIKEKEYTDSDADLATQMPFERVYSRGAWHRARAFLLLADGQDERATLEERLGEKWTAKANQRLNASIKTKVARLY